MFFVNPPHPKTRSALQAGFDLASDIAPINDHQLDAQMEVYRAVSGGDLYDVLDALNRARRHMPRTWRGWHTEFVQAVDLQILRDLRPTSHREAAA